MAISKIDIEKQRQLVTGKTHRKLWEAVACAALREQELVLAGKESHRKETNTRKRLNVWLGMDFFTIPNPVTARVRGITGVTHYDVDKKG